MQYPHVAWQDVRAGLRVVLLQAGPVIEVVTGADAMGAPTWRRVDTADPGEVRLRKLEGWKEIASACDLSPDQWRMCLKASRRPTDPLNVQYDAFDRPYVYEVVLRDWLARRGARSALAHELERAAETRGPSKVRRPRRVRAAA